MVIGIMGESCTGKSTLAQKLQSLLAADVYTGKDYLRLAKNETIAKKLFQEQLEAAMGGANIIYVISEKEHLALLPDKAIRVLVTADLEVIKQRFAQRMHGALPAPVAAILEKKHGCFDHEKHHVHVVSGHSDVDEICRSIQHLAGTP